jgi:hypothetical protein
VFGQMIAQQLYSAGDEAADSIDVASAQIGA